MSIEEKVAYLRGLLEGMEIDGNSNEGKIYFAFLDALSAAGDKIESLQEQVDVLYDLTDEIDEDLGDIEQLLIEDDDDEDDDCDCGCDLQVTCPNCDEVICVDDDIISEGAILCPDCGATLEFDFDEDEDDFDDEDED